MSELFKKEYNPDVLSCIANLSNDEVFTPPELVNQMLDMLPEELWSDPGATFLDPACKSGVFLREIAKRLIGGLADEIPDLEERLEHIYKKQLFGMAITELTSLLSRRSVYCSKWANGPYSVVQFENARGNIDYLRLEHTWEGGRCKYCGAAEREYKREEGLEQYAYEFIHLDNPEEVFNMKFDVIIGNPPYQLSDGGGGLGSSAVPIYQTFVERSMDLLPRYMSMIIPARWQSGGRGLGSFRAEMLSDCRFEKMVTFADSRDCFDGVDIAGGVCYFLWSRSYHGDCLVEMRSDGRVTERKRALNEFSIFIPSNIAVDIVRKVNASTQSFYVDRVSGQKPFGIRSSFHDPQGGDLVLRWRGGVTRWPSSDVSAGREMIDKWKVIVSKASAEHAGQSDKNGQRKILTVIEILKPGEICSETYIVIDSFSSEAEARVLMDYLKTKFARFLIWQATPTQNISKNCFLFLPVFDGGEAPTDEELYTRYGLTELEREEIEAKIKPMGGDSDAC